VAEAGRCGVAIDDRQPQAAALGCFEQAELRGPGS
jgi:hypothetical protein